MTSSFVQRISSTLNQIQALKVYVPNPKEVQDYLMRFPDMVEVVGEVARIALERLPEAWLSLEVYHDPEVEDEHLVLYARFRQYDGTTMERIRSIRKDYRRLLVGKSGWIILTTDFRSPEVS